MRLGKKWVILIPTVVMAATAFVAWPYLPKLYQSEAILAVFPRRVPERYVKPMVMENLEDRWDSLLGEVLSRENLVPVIVDLHLYPTEVQRMPMLDVVEKMRGEVQTQKLEGDKFRVAYISTDPEKAADVTNRLAGLIVVKDVRSDTTQQVTEFLTAEADRIRRELSAHEKTLEQARIERNAIEVRLLTLEEGVLEAAYKSLLANKLDSELAVTLEHVQMGGRFTILDRASVPERPLGLTRSALTSWGAVAGLLVGLTLVVAPALSRARCA